MFPKTSIQFLLRLRPALRWLMKLRSSPRAIAGGFALGTFIAFTPTVGLQIILAICFSTLFNWNRPAAILPVWVSNPVTIPPIFTFNYFIGQKIWGGPPVSEVSQLFITIGTTMARLDFWDFEKLMHSLLGLGMELIIPLCLGSCIVGLIAATIVYFPMLQLMCFLAKRKRQRHVLK